MTGHGTADREQRARLRAALLEAAPWLADTDHGPRAVAAGPCDGCGTSLRLVPTCGPAAYEAVCRDCLVALGDDAWCDGHRRDGQAARDWVGRLPAWWEDAVLLWWIATGEIRSAGLPPVTGDRLGQHLGRRVAALLEG